MDYFWLVTKTFQKIGNFSFGKKMVNLSNLFNEKSFCVGQNSISHVKLMQKISK
jgi:hypothetical protein